MMRLTSLLFCFISTFSWCQDDSLVTEIDSIPLEVDFVPLKLDGEWLWYDIANDKVSDSIQITNFAQTQSGLYTAYIVRDSSHWGMLSSRGDTLRPFAYDSIIVLGNELFTLFDNQWSYHLSNDLVWDSLIPVSFDSLYKSGGDIYLFHDGKTGIVTEYGSLIPAKYDQIHRFGCNSGMSFDVYYMSILGNEYNLVSVDGEELLPDGIWDLRCTEDAIFEFRRGNHPEYYLPHLDEIVSPNGRDIIFYDDRAYKIFNEDKSRSELHLSEGSVLKDQFDDYFLLVNDYIAVRKNGKVGLTKGGLQILGDVKYDQINPISDPISRDNRFGQYFRFYLGDSCGLMDMNGTELFEAKYANIITTKDDNRFIVLDGNVSGVVDRNGRTVIPLKYERLYLENGSKQFIIQDNSKVGLFDYNGKQKTPIEYDGYRVLQTFNDGDFRDAILVLRKRGKYYFVNSKGFIDRTGFDHYNYSTDVLKTYSSKAISVFLFGQRGEIEERSNYPIYRNATIRRNYSDFLNGVTNWAISELEENQKEGYFGLRFYRKRGFGVSPTYRTIRNVIFNDYLASVDGPLGTYQLTNELTAEVIGGVHHLKVGSGSTNEIPYFSSELSVIRGGSGDRFINRTLEGDQDHAYSRQVGSDHIDLSEKIHFSDEADFSARYRRYFRGGEIELCSIDSSEVSFYEYFRYVNSIDACRVSPEIMKMVLNPKLGVRFKNAECEVINASVFGANKGFRNYASAQVFEKYKYINQSVYFEKSLNSETGTLRLDYLPEKDKKEVSVDNVLASPANGDFNLTQMFNYFEVKIKKNQMAKIHVDYPNYFFHQDSINLSYEAGRITRRVDSNTVRLLDPNGTVIADNCLMIRYLSEERFAILRKDGWRLIDKNGKQVSNNVFSAVSEFKRDRAEFRYKDGKAVEINSNGEELLPLPEPRIFLDDDHYYFASDSKSIINRFSSASDQAGEGEKYMSRGFFVSKANDKTSVRRFGTPKKMELKSIPKLKAFGSCLYYRKGKHMYSIDSNLHVTKHKKMEKFRMVTPEIGWLEGKQDQLVDSDWNEIHEMTKDQRFEIRDGELVVLENDSIYQNFGALKPEEKRSNDLMKTPETVVISADGKYGVQRDQDTILPVRYSWLSKINDKEFMTTIDSEMQLYDAKLKRIGNRPFDRFIETGNGNFVFFYKDQVFVLFEDRETFKLIR